MLHFPPNCHEFEFCRKDWQYVCEVTPSKVSGWQKKNGAPGTFSFQRCGAGEGALMTYVMGSLRTLMEWATVPVLAVAMCLPHGALVYWLSSSSLSLAQVIS